MKAPAFWYRNAGLAALALAPVGQLYRIGSLLRRAFCRPYKATVPTLCVGNIVAGGAGKTPTALALARLLILRGFRPVFVTRGYGGKEKGPLKVDPTKHTARDVGDEALLLARMAPCWIGRDRPAAMKEAEKEATHLILDDGLQNPNIKADINLLVVDGYVGFGNRRILPAGPLRETLNDAFSRVAAIVMVGEDTQRVTQCLGKTVLQAYLRPGLTTEFLSKPRVLAFAGIGRPQKFYDSCREAGLTVVETQDFADHHPYSHAEISDLIASAQRKDLRLITTQKDWVRLPDTLRDSVAVLEVELVFADEEALLRILQSSMEAPREPS